MEKVSDCLWYKNSGYYIDVVRRNITVRKSIKKTRTVKDDEYFAGLIIKIKNAIDLGVYTPELFFPSKASKTKVTTFDEAVTLFKVTLAVAKSTKRGYFAACRFWLKAFTGKSVKNIKKSDVVKVLVDFQGAAHTKNNYKGVLLGIFEVLLGDKTLDYSPAAGIPKFKNHLEDTDDVDPFEREEAKLILEYLYKKNEQAGNYFAFQLATGARPSETIALQWSDVDFLKQQVRITKSLVEHEMGNTKTLKSKRFIDLDATALAVLQAQKKYSFFSEDQRIFQNPHTLVGWASEKKQRTVWWIPALKALGIRYRPPYQCRHCYASWLLTDGIDVAYVSKQLGHSSIAITEKHYATYMSSKSSEVLAKRNALIAERDEAQKNKGNQSTGSL